MILRGPHCPDLLQNETLPGLFEATAARFPEKTALIFDGRTPSYSELDRMANRVASCMLAQGVGSGQVIGLWLLRGLDLLVAQLGIAKAGAAWLPFDADIPVARIEACMEDAQSPGLLTCRAHLPLLADFTRPV